MKIILTMAISANGIIASKTGSEEFLSDVNWHQFVKLAHKIGCCIWGRKTYEAVLSWEGEYLKDIQDVKKIIVSRSDLKLKEGFELAHSPEGAVKLLEKAGFQEAIVTGGSILNSEFAKRGLIDEIILDVNPSVVGNGIPVFHPEEFALSLKLLNVEKITDEIVELHYEVKK